MGYKRSDLLCVKEKYSGLALTSCANCGSSPGGSVSEISCSRPYNDTQSGGLKRMAANVKEEGIADEVVDQLLAGRDPATIFESGGLIDELKKRLAERMLNAELDQHLGNTAEEDAAAIATATATRPQSPTAASWSLRYRATGTGVSTRY